MARTSQTSDGAGTAASIDPQNAQQLEAGRALVAQYLNEAHATEAALVTTLQTHITMTPQGPYRQLLERHLAETRQHAGAIERRLSELGDGPGLIASAVGLVETVIGQVLALSKGPVDLLRGGSGEEKLLKNARDECATEALEIATYDSLEVAAQAVGDHATAELARRHRAQEEQMLAGLRREIPGLTAATIRERVGGEMVYDPSTTGAADAARGARDAAQRAGGQAADAAQGAAQRAGDAAQGAADRAGDAAQGAAQRAGDAAQGAADRAGDAAQGAAQRAGDAADAATPDGPPLAGYDTLNAGQVISRLRGLSADQLRAVEAYERRNRNRRTVLARIEVLRETADGTRARDLGGS